jgi:hypothetical protein
MIDDSLYDKVLYKKATVAIDEIKQDIIRFLNNKIHNAAAYF